MQESGVARGQSISRLLLLVCLVVLLLLAAASALDLGPTLGFARLVALFVTVGVLVIVATVYLLAPLFSAKERERARAAYGTHADVIANTVAAIAWGNLVFLPVLLFLVNVVTDWRQGPTGIAQHSLAMLRGMQPLVVFLALVGLDIAFVLVIYLRLLRTGACTARELGLVGDRLRRNLAIGALGWFIILIVSGVVGSILMQYGVRQTQSEQLALGDATPDLFFLIVAAGSLLAPFAEELFFRGYVFRSYLTRIGPWGAYPISAALFAVLHLNLPALPLVLIMGGILAFLFRVSGSLVPAITAHGLNNLLALLAFYFLTGAQ
ncbi:MAG: CPBP family intramembrane glutamic endopeptidase [Chloroflexota bacterium]